MGLIIIFICCTKSTIPFVDFKEEVYDERQKDEDGVRSSTYEGLVIW